MIIPVLLLKRILIWRTKGSIIDFINRIGVVKLLLLPPLNN